MLEGKLIKDFLGDCVGDVKIVVENGRRKGYLERSSSQKVHTGSRRREGMSVMLTGSNWWSGAISCYLGIMFSDEMMIGIRSVCVCFSTREEVSYKRAIKYFWIKVELFHNQCRRWHLAGSKRDSLFFCELNKNWIIYILM